MLMWGSDPINFVDPSGLETHVIYWQSVGYGQSSYGHISVRINNTSYSWSPSGMFITNYKEYETSNTAFRSGLGVILNISKKQEKNLEKYLKEYEKNNSYFIIGNSCLDPIESKLNEFGFDVGKSLLPFSLYWNVEKNLGKGSYIIRR